MINKRDISKLEGIFYLHALAKYGSKRVVAERLGTSVDTINKYINDLESRMNTVFLTSNGRGTNITPEGERILKATETIIEALRTVDDYATTMAQFAGPVRIGTTDAIASYIGLAEISVFLRSYPKLCLDIHINDRLPDMRNLEVDICIDYDPPVLPELVLVAIKKVRCGLFASKQYLEEYGVPKDIADLVANHRICDKDNHVEYVPGWKEIIDNAAHLVFKSNSVFSLRSAIANGIGVGICPLCFNSPDLVHLDHLKLDFDINIYLIAHKDTKDMPRIRLVLDFLKTLLETRSIIRGNREFNH